MRKEKLFYMNLWIQKGEKDINKINDEEKSDPLSCSIQRRSE
jgi:hypothetical protein